MALKKLPIPGTDILMSVQSLSISILVISLGRKAVWAVLIYLGLASYGLPVLACGTANSVWYLSVLAGYYFGFLVSSFVLARVLEVLKPRNFWKSWFCLACNESLILGCGFMVLCYYFGSGQAWWVGVWPYIFGAVLKVTLATFLYLIHLPGFKSSTILN